MKSSEPQILNMSPGEMTKSKSVFKTLQTGSAELSSAFVIFNYCNAVKGKGREGQGKVGQKDKPGRARGKTHHLSSKGKQPQWKLNPLLASFDQEDEVY